MAPEYSILRPVQTKEEVQRYKAMGFTLKDLRRLNRGLKAAINEEASVEKLVQMRYLHRTAVALREIRS